MRTPTNIAPAPPRTPRADPFGTPNYGGRQSRPDYFNAFAGGMGIVPRRGWDERTSNFIAQAANNPVRSLRFWSTAFPLLVLSVLVDTHPLGQLALSNDLSLAFAPGTTRIVAVENENDKDTNPEGTALIENLWRSLPGDIGGLDGLQWTLGEQTVKTGMWSVEAVPGETGQGITDTPDISPLSLRFRDTDNGRILEQEQIGRNNPGTDMTTALPGWQPLDQSYCLTAAWRGSRNNPYGMPRYGAFLGEGLADVSEQRDLRDWLHTVAWPRLAAMFPYDKVVEYARNNPEILIGKRAGGGDLTETEYAAIQFGLYMAKLDTLKADDIIMLPMGGDIKALNLAATGLADIYDRRRLRVIQSLDQLPNLMGVTDGGTQAYAVEQSRVYYQKLEAFRAFVNRGPVALANLHLRLLGVNLIARADTDPIQPRDRVSDANAQAVEIQNARALTQAGFISEDEASQRLTGSAPVDAEKAKKWGDAPVPVSPTTPPSIIPAPDPGAKEEQDN